MAQKRPVSDFKRTGEKRELKGYDTETNSFC